jgi:transcriptional regulator with XRE-family HTH domain
MVPFQRRFALSALSPDVGYTPVVKGEKPWLIASVIYHGILYRVNDLAKKSFRCHVTMHSMTSKIPPYHYFRDQLQHLMGKCGLYNSLLAEKSGLSRAYVGKLAEGWQLPSEAALRKLEPHLGVPFDELANYIELDRRVAKPNLVRMGFDAEIEQMIADNERRYINLWKAGKLADEADTLQTVREVGNAWRDAVIQLRAERIESERLRARVATLEGNGTPAEAQVGNNTGVRRCTLPFHGKVGSGAWPVKARREISLSLPVTIVGNESFAAEISTNALDRVSIITGDVVVASSELTPTDGDIVLVKLPKGTACLRYQLFPSGALLVPDSHEPNHGIVPVTDETFPFAVVTYIHRPGKELRQSGV